MPAKDGTYPTVVSMEMMDSSQSIHTVVTVTLLEVIDLKVRVIIRPMVNLLLCEIKLGFSSHIINIKGTSKRFFLYFLVSAGHNQPHSV
jgi:hypothetical protein